MSILHLHLITKFATVAWALAVSSSSTAAHLGSRYDDHSIKVDLAESAAKINYMCPTTSDCPERYSKRLQDLRDGIFLEDSSSSPSVEYEDRCVDTSRISHSDYGRADADIKDFCKGGVDLSVPSAPIWRTNDHTKADINMNLQIAVQWSVRPEGQDGCNAYQDSNHLGEKTCIEQFLAAVNRCNKETITQKLGQAPMAWNSPNGCVDFWLVGHGPEWSCNDLKVKSPECEGAQKGT